MAIFVILGAFIIGGIEGGVVFWLRDQQMIQYIVAGGFLALDFLISVFVTVTVIQEMLWRNK